MARTEIRSLADKLDNAFQCFASDNGDGFAARDWQGAYEYREEGYRLGEEAYDMPAEDRADWIEAQTYAFDESARYLIGCAADYRLAEMVKHHEDGPALKQKAA